MKFTEDPFGWVDWCTGQFGQEVINELRRVAKKPVKWNKNLREDIYQHYKKELVRLEDLRAEGEIGRLEIIPHECMFRFGEQE